jgi:membrane-bound serine protease (ClpP class)
VLLAVEVFLIPGFGVTGIAGIALIISSILMAMVANFPGGGTFDLPADMLSDAVLEFTLALVVLSLGVWAAGGLLPKTAAFRRLTLQAVVDGHTPAPAPVALHPGLRGVTLSPCRPGGVGRFAGERVDIVSTGDLLASGVEVELVARRANTWEVRPLPKT